MEKYNKVSGRMKQLLKVGVADKNFSKSLLSSPFNDNFKLSLINNGHTDRHPMDWQIDLGNYCNSSCIFCRPEYSSRLANEFLSLNLIDRLPESNWSLDQKSLHNFLQYFDSIENIKYLHFIGGETLITPSFKTILQHLVASNRSKNITLGFTTNLTVWMDDIVTLLDKFENINLGVSVETLTNVNDYVRYPSKLKTVRQNLEKWTSHVIEKNWLMQIRITPTCLTIHDLTSIFDYAWDNNVNVESCNFLTQPEFLKINVLPLDIRHKIKETFIKWLSDKNLDNDKKIINIRDRNIAKSQIYQDTLSYVNYLDSAEDESFRGPALINFLKKLEQSRNNSILQYLPQYEKLFRGFGY